MFNYHRSNFELWVYQPSTRYTKLIIMSLGNIVWYIISVLSKNFRLRYCLNSLSSVLFCSVLFWSVLFSAAEWICLWSVCNKQLWFCFVIWCQALRFIGRFYLPWWWLSDIVLNHDIFQHQNKSMSCLMKGLRPANLSKPVFMITAVLSELNVNMLIKAI